MKPPLPPGAIQPRCGAQYHFGGLRFEEIIYAPGLYMPSHTHDVAFLDFCVQGTLQDFWEGQAFVRGPATLNFLPIGAPHATRFQEDVKTFQMVLEAPWLERVQQVAPLQETCTGYQNGLPVWIAARMYREFQHRDSLSSLVLEGMLLELLAAMARQSAGSPESHGPRWLRQAKDFLHAHFTESLSMETVAAAAGVHPSHLMRGFRQHYQCTVGDYVRRLRIEYACHRLSTADASPLQIALEAGFADQSHFIRTFKGCMGMTPTEFQKVSGRASLRQ